MPCTGSPLPRSVATRRWPGCTSPADARAAIREVRFGLKVAALSMGPPNAEATLRKPLRLGIVQIVTQKSVVKKIQDLAGLA